MATFNTTSSIFGAAASTIRFASSDRLRQSATMSSTCFASPFVASARFSCAAAAENS